MDTVVSSEDQEKAVGEPLRRTVALRGALCKGLTAPTITVRIGD